MPLTRNLTLRACEPHQRQQTPRCSTTPHTSDKHAASSELHSEPTEIKHGAVLQIQGSGALGWATVRAAACAFHMSE